MCFSHVSVLALLDVCFGLGEELDSAPVEPLLVTEPPQIFLRISSVSVSSHFRFLSGRWECSHPDAAADDAVGSVSVWTVTGLDAQHDGAFGFGRGNGNAPRLNNSSEHAQQFQTTADPKAKASTR